MQISYRVNTSRMLHLCVVDVACYSEQNPYAHQALE